MSDSGKSELGISESDQKQLENNSESKLPTSPKQQVIVVCPKKDVPLWISEMEKMIPEQTSIASDSIIEQNNEHNTFNKTEEILVDKSTTLEEKIVTDETTTQEETKIVTDETTVPKESVTVVSTKPILLSDGKRPFTAAMEKYIETMNMTIQNAKAHLVMHPQHDYARLHVKLFDAISVHCVDQFGTKSIKKYQMHILHYGPFSRLSAPIPPEVTPQFRGWFGFHNRYKKIWTKVNANGKNPGGDGTGENGTACSPFRDLQMKLLDEGFYLVDMSDFRYNQYYNKVWYMINIRLYRNKPQDGPFRMPHGYGFIPTLGSVPKPLTPIFPLPSVVPMYYYPGYSSQHSHGMSLSEYPSLVESKNLADQNLGQLQTNGEKYSHSVPKSFHKPVPRSVQTSITPIEIEYNSYK